MYFAKPSGAYGYYVGWPLAGNQGSGQGVNMAGSNVFSAGQGTTQSSSSSSSWSPTILYMFVLIFIEMFVFAMIARRL